jgi:hypothetical protein
MRIATELRAVDLISGHQFEEEIGASSSENRLFIPKMEFSVKTGELYERGGPWGKKRSFFRISANPPPL